jgi:hypothetical protein
MLLPRLVTRGIFAGVLLVGIGSVVSMAQSKKAPPPSPARAKSPSPAVNNEYVHKQFGDNCTLLDGPPQFVADMDGDAIDDLVIAARCRNPMADQDEYGFRVSDPYDTFLGFGDVKVTSTFASDEPERRGMSLLIVHGDGSGAWRSETPKAKFLMINLPFRTLTVKKLALKKKTVLGIYMEERGEGEDTSSVLYWDGKKYRYQQLGSSLE